MMDKMIFDRLKIYKIVNHDMYKVSETFPIMFISLMQLLMVKLDSGHVINLKFLPAHVKPFLIQFSNVIKNQEFDKFDDLILGLISTYYFNYPPYIIVIDLDPEYKEKFITTCNSFRGKHWNDILSIFIDSLYELISHSSIPGGTLVYLA
jgi:hypothetical protein